MNRLSSINGQTTVILVEGKPVSTGIINEEHQKLMIKLKSIEKIKVNDKNFVYNSSFVGFMFIGTCMYVSMPKVYITPSNEGKLLQDIKTLFLTMIKTNNAKSESEIHGNDEEFIEESNHFKLTSMNFLINDYLDNGDYRKESTYTRNAPSSKILWGKTINKHHPIISNGNLIYNNLIYEAKSYDNAKEIIRLQKIAVKISLEKIGWLFDLKIENFHELSLSTEYDKDYVQAILERELREVNNIRNIRMLKTMLDILVGYKTDSNKEKTQFLYTKSFHTIWENMCSYVFGNEYGKYKLIVPSSRWEVFHDDSTKKTKQIPDILLLNDDTLHIVDAKYYDVESTLPGWSDIVKQFFYKQTIEEYIPELVAGKKGQVIERVKAINKITNSFVFPSYKVLDYEVYGKTVIDKVSTLGEIDSYLVNVRLVMEKFLKGKKILFNGLVMKKES